MNEMHRQYHPISNLFPLMQDDEFSALKQDISEHGQLEPIWLHPDGSIIDGRNRHRACIELGIAPQFRTWDGAGSLVSFVVSLNLHRRHLDAGQRGMIGLKVKDALAEEIAIDANEKRRQAQLDHWYGPSNETGVLVQMDKNSSDNSQRDARAEAAAVMNVGKGTMARAEQVAKHAPDLADKVLAGTVKLNAAYREIKERKRELRRMENAELATQASDPLAVNAKFATILIDPPWDWGDEGDVNQLGRAKPDYATMSKAELLRLPVAELADTDCHLYLWITNRSLPKGFELLETWGFRYITCITLVKPHFGMGNYFRGQTEHILFGVKGSQMLKRKDAGTVFFADRGPNGHSSKPEEIYDLIESCSPGPYLEMFARNKRESWSRWGADA